MPGYPYWPAIAAVPLAYAYTGYCILASIGLLAGRLGGGLAFTVYALLGTYFRTTSVFCLTTYGSLFGTFRYELMSAIKAVNPRIVSTTEEESSVVLRSNLDFLISLKHFILCFLCLFLVPCPIMISMS
jgi:hypothetical protein